MCVSLFLGRAGYKSEVSRLRTDGLVEKVINDSYGGRVVAWGEPMCSTPATRPGSIRTPSTSPTRTTLINGFPQIGLIFA